MGLFSFLFNRNYLREGRLAALDRQTAADNWQKIEQQVLLGKPSNMRQAVIDADKLTDYILRQLYPTYDTMGERLKAAKPKFINYYEIYDGLWYSHKIRNELVHNINFELPSIEVATVLGNFKKALEFLGAL